MKTFKIRAAKPGDINEIYAIFRLLETMHRHAYPNIFKKPEKPNEIKKYLMDCIKASEVGFFVAEDRKKVVGIVNAQIRHTPKNALMQQRTFLNISDIVVDEDFRELGVGSALMEQIHSWALEHGITQIQLTVWDFNHEAQNFYKQLGYQMLHHSMLKELP
jgi:ribosomal protein S18 acetylase RimI-like enzyme